MRPTTATRAVENEIEDEIADMRRRVADAPESIRSWIIGIELVKELKFLRAAIDNLATTARDITQGGSR